MESTDKMFNYEALAKDRSTFLHFSTSEAPFSPAEGAFSIKFLECSTSTGERSMI